MTTGPMMRLNVLLPTAVAALAAAAMVIAVLTEPPTVAQLPLYLPLLLPVFWLAVAGWLSRHDDTPARHATTCAAMFVLINVLSCLANITAYRFIGRYFQYPGWMHEWFVHPYHLTGPAVVTAVVPAAVGWWQRRREHLADDDSAACARGLEVT